MSALQLLTKVTRRCNLRCSYCNDWRSRSETMSHETFERLVSGCLGDKSPYDTVAFIWHGGEPTMVSPDWFRRTFEIQQTRRGRTQTVANGIQTNATLLSDRWLDLLAEHPEVTLSVSVDATPDVHNALRVNSRFEGTWARVVEGLGRLRDASIPYDLLFVLSDEVRALEPSEVWGSLSDLSPRAVDFVPVRPPNQGTDSPSLPETRVPQFAEIAGWQAWACQLFDLWWSQPSSVPIRTFESIMATLIAAESPLCVLGTNCFGRVMAVEPDGAIGSCDIFYNEPGHVYGQAGDKIWEFDLQSALPALREAEDERILGLASTCAWLDRCHGGCPHDDLVHRQQGFSKASQQCCGWAPLYEHVSSLALASLEAARALRAGSAAIVSAVSVSGARHSREGGR